MKLNGRRREKKRVERRREKRVERRRDRGAERGREKGAERRRGQGVVVVFYDFSDIFRCWTSLQLTATFKTLVPSFSSNIFPVFDFTLSAFNPFTGLLDLRT